MSESVTQTAAPADAHGVHKQARACEPSVGAAYAAMGIVLDSIALANVNEAGAFGVIGVGLTAGGAYVVIAGAVARGMQLARG